MMRADLKVKRFITVEDQHEAAKLIAECFHRLGFTSSGRSYTPHHITVTDGSFTPTDTGPTLASRHKTSVSLTNHTAGWLQI